MDEGTAAATYSSMDAVEGRGHRGSESGSLRRRVSRGLSRQSAASCGQDSVADVASHERSPLSTMFRYMMKQSYASALIIMMVLSHLFLSMFYLDSIHIFSFGQKEENVTDPLRLSGDKLYESHILIGRGPGACFTNSGGLSDRAMDHPPMLFVHRQYDPTPGRTVRHC